MRISVIGTGYLGATQAVCLAELGFEVLGVDRDTEKVRLLAGGTSPISEPGLQDLLARHVRSGRLRFTTSVTEAADFADVHFLCVGTPQAPMGLAADLTALFASARELARNMTRDGVIIGKSTVPVGTADRLVGRVAEVLPAGVSAEVAWNPEFLREGHGVQDTLRPERLVFGVRGLEAELVLRRIHERLIGAGVPVHVTDLATAELAKVAANSFLATKISFINAVAEVSEQAGADIVALADILGDDSRIGRGALDAGIGFGGGCLPKDLRAFSARAVELGAHALPNLLREVDAINERARQRTLDLVTTLCGRDLRGKRVAVLGVAFKPGSDDVRDSPALEIAGRLHLLGAEVRVYDPEAGIKARAVCPGLTYVASAETALTDADVVLHLTDWPEFAELDPSRVGALVRTRCVVDGRNRLDPERWRAAGWSFHGVGRTDVPSGPAVARAATALGAAAVQPSPRRQSGDVGQLERM